MNKYADVWLKECQREMALNAAQIEHSMSMRKYTNTDSEYYCAQQIIYNAYRDCQRIFEEALAKLAEEKAS